MNEPTADGASMAYDAALDDWLQESPENNVLATYTLQLIGPRAKWDHGHPAPIGFAAYVQETEENLTDLLPAGYRVEIKEWDE